MVSAGDIDQFKREGFLLLKGVFSAGEIEAFRRIGDEAPRSVDLASLPGVANLWSDPRLVETAKALLGGPITFFGEASHLRIRFETPHPKLGRVLHHDAKGTVEHLFNRQHAPTPKPYPILRFAIYLQDHAQHSGGLKLVPGSHQMDSSAYEIDALRYYNVPSEPGDLVVFCNKILHTAHALRSEADPAAALSPAAEDAADPALFLPFQQDRRSIFIDFAGSDTLADIYIKSRALRPTSVRNGFLDTYVRGDVQRGAQAANVTLRLDAAVIEAVTKIMGAIVDGAFTPEGTAMLKVLPALCRLSAPWSAYYNFLPEMQGHGVKYAEGDAEAGLALLRLLVPRIDELRNQIRTAARDPHMQAQSAM